MVFQIQPFTGAHIAALAGIGDIPNIAEAYFKGEGYGRNRLASQGQYEAAQLAQAGDIQGAQNRLLQTGAASGGDYLQFQAQQAARGQQASQFQQQEARLRTAQEEDARYRREALVPPDQRLYENLLKQGVLDPGTSYGDYRRIQEGKPSFGSINQFFQGQGPPPAGVTPPTAPEVPPGTPAPPGQFGPRIKPLGAVEPSQQPLQAVPPQQPPLADVTPVPGITGPPPGTPPGQVHEQQIAQAVTPPAVPGGPPPIQPVGSAQPNNPYGFPNDLWEQAQAVAKVDPDQALEMLKRPPRENVPPEATIVNQFKTGWRSDTKDFVERKTAVTTIRQAYEDAKANPGVPGFADTSMIIGFLKYLDPGSVVRETEFGTIEATGSFGQRGQQILERFNSGAKLTDDQRLGILRQIERQYKGHFQTYNQQLKRARGEAQALGVPGELAAPDVSDGVYPLGYDPGTGKIDEGAYKGLAGGATVQTGPPGSPLGQGASDWIQQNWGTFMQRFNQRMNRGAGQ